MTERAGGLSAPQRDLRLNIPPPGIFLPTARGKGFQGRSIAIAVPSPPPMQIAAMPRFGPRVSSACSRVTMIRAPEAPIGMAQRTGAAVDVDPVMRNAELVHEGHRHHGKGLVHLPQIDIFDRPAQPRQQLLRRRAPGRWGNQPGACAWLAWPRIWARMGRPCGIGHRCARPAPAPPPRQRSTTNWPPSPCRPCERRVSACGIFSGRALAGCSSASISTRRLWP